MTISADAPQAALRLDSDVTDPATSRVIFLGADALVHLSGIAQVPRFLDALESAGVRRAVFVGSAGVHTRLISSGADAKRRRFSTYPLSLLSFIARLRIE